MADTHNDRLDRFARRSGLVDDDAPNIIIAERARAAADALAADALAYLQEIKQEIQDEQR